MQLNYDVDSTSFTDCVGFADELLGFKSVVSFHYLSFVPIFVEMLITSVFEETPIGSEVKVMLTILISMETPAKEEQTILIFMVMLA